MHANASNRDHLFQYKAVELSTYGILFLGTPHQGSASVDLAKIVLRILSIHLKTNDAVLKNLGLHSKALQEQLDQYSAISHKYATKFYYEMYETKLIRGVSKMVYYFTWLAINVADLPFSLLNNILQLSRGFAMRSRLDSTKTM